MSRRYVVSTECPTCGAPLDFGEGSTAVRCGHCRSNLLVTGRRQVLSYSIRERVAPHLAVQIARFAEPHEEGPFRVVEPVLFFLPYYRLTGHDFRWVRERVRREPESAMPFRPRGENSPGVDFSAISPLGVTREKVEFQDRWVEKNFVGVERFGLYSLGVRPTVLRLELFQRAALERRGRIAVPDVEPAAAMAHGLRTGDAHKVLFRQVIAPVLSVVYFPFWVVVLDRRGEQRLTLIDGVSEKLVRRDVPGDLLTALSRPSAGEPPTVGFRPLACPNCGWDLPVNPDDVTFQCRHCGRIWRLDGTRLLETRYEVAAIDGLEAARHLPYWILEARIGASTVRRLLLPAFRYRRLKILSDLATSLARTAPTWLTRDLDQGTPPDLHGCFFDRDDAAALARFICAGLDDPGIEDLEAFDPASVRTSEPSLAWIPQRGGPHSLRDPFTGFALPKNLFL